MAHSPSVLIANANLQILNNVTDAMRRNNFVNLLETTAAKMLNRAQFEQPDIIVIGLEFADMDCASMLSTLKIDTASRDIPVFLACDENETPNWSDKWIKRFDGVMTWPFEDAPAQAHMRAGLRFCTMRTELTKRGETLRQFGEDSGDN